jgi:hypothetical protein
VADAIRRPRSARVRDADDLVFALPGRGIDGDRVALVLADQRARQRRGDRDHRQFDVRLQVADDLVALFLVGFDVGQRDRRAEHHAASGIQLGHVDHFGMRKLAFQLLDAAFDEALLLAGGVVLGVFLQVAMRARFGNGVDDLGAFHRFQLVQFLAQPLRAFQCQWRSHCPCSSLWSSCSAHTGPVPRNSSECTSARAPAMVVE